MGNLGYVSQQLSQQLSRRSLLQGAGALLLGSALLGCRRQGQGAVLQVDVLADAVPPILLDELQRQFKPDARFQIRQANTLTDLYARLQSYQPSDTDAAARPGRRANLASLGDTWLTGAIQNNLIQPLTVDNLEGWDKLPTAWQQVVRRNADGYSSSNGQVWAAPYRWGTLAIVYRKDQFGTEPPTDWDVLWKPELARRISLPDQARAVIGLTLKYMGASANLTNVGAIANLPEILASLQQQVLFYSSDAYLQPLILEDTWLAVGWSTDIAPLLRKNPRLGAVVPRSGTLLFADTWVQPAGAASEDVPADVLNGLIQQWISYFWEPETATRLSLLGDATSPVLLNQAATVPTSLQAKPLALPSTEILARSEFLEPLPPATAQTYRQLWETMRQRQT